MNGKPPIFSPFNGGKWAVWREFPRFKTMPSLWVLALGVSAAYLIGALLIIFVPQNNYDGMTYHLSRVGYWMQHQTLAPWPTPNPRQTTFPINAELGLLWTIIFWGSDQITGFVQWLSSIGIMVSIFGLARLIGATRPQSLFAALIWAAFPQVVLQSTTTQNDLVSTFFFVSMLYFLFLGLRRDEKNLLLLSGASLGLAVGTKVTVFFMLPGLILFWLVMVWRVKRAEKCLLGYWTVAAISGIMLLGAFSYIQNWIFYGDFFSVPDWTAYFIIPPHPRQEMLANNIFFYLYQFFDFTGVTGSLGSSILVLKASLAQFLIQFLHIPEHFSWLYSFQNVLYPSLLIHEDSTWFGPLSFMLLVPSTIYQGFLGIHRREKVRIGIVFLALGFLVTISLVLEWSPYKSRYFILPTAVLSALMAYYFQPNKVRTSITWVMVMGALWVLGWTMIFNLSKPLVGESAIWKRGQEEIRMSHNLDMIPVLDMVNHHVPQDAKLATRIGSDDWDYLLFGPDFSRTLYPLDPHEKYINLEALKAWRVDYLLVSPRERPFLQVPAQLNLIDESERWTLYTISSPVNSFQRRDEIEAAILGLVDEKQLLQVDQSLAGIVGVVDLKPGEWGIESRDNDGFYWIGEGAGQGMTGFLWSEDELGVKIILTVEPGPSREDSLRNIQGSFYWYGTFAEIRKGNLIEYYQFSDRTQLEMIVHLQYGLNEFRFETLDKATIPQLPNGDTRPLLVYLEKIEVLPIDD